MQPRIIAAFITLIPLISANTAYLISASANHVPWCIPYIEGCTSISRAARHGDALFLFRGLMMFYAVLLIYYWWLVKLWINKLDKQPVKISRIIFWLGTCGAIFLIVYIDFLGSTGSIYRFMRRYGVIFYFSLTPLAHLLMINHVNKLKIKNHKIPITRRIIRYQTTIVSMILILGLTSVVMSYTEINTYESENIIEWNYSLLLSLLFASSFYMWRDLKLKLIIENR
ncbi:MAG: hypothetical protein OQK70_11965 [Gammaproteobacteria bacterium]|nr:hypothetical protein [Gammaproteobacteria bacterium]MCW9055621.1 hypothetical protein [Gammaproteobacteria bacterium]